MNKRTSLANPAVERLRSPTSNPLRRRSSIALKSSSVELADNDDEAERAILRRNADTSATLMSPSSSNRRSLNVGAIIGDMSSPQIVEGLTECIKLNTQNKISIKNAFSLKMIDFMSYLVRKRDEGISSLQMAGTSLDVSAKIYALRIDGLHHDILRMAGNLDKDNNNDKSADTTISNDNDGSQDPEQLQKKKKKKKRSNKIRTTIEALQGDVETVSLCPVMFGDSDCQTSDMLYQAILPQHCGLGLALHPYRDTFLDDNSADISNNTDDEPRIKWPPLDFDPSLDIATIPGGFEFLNWSEKDDSSRVDEISQESPSIHDNLAFDLDRSLPIDDEPPEITENNFFGMNDDNEENMEGYYVEKRPTEKIANILELMPDKKLEYSFFCDNINVRWMGPAHWKIKRGATHLGSSNVTEACRQGAGRKKKELILSFDNGDINCEALTIPKKITSKVHAKTIKNTWSEKKLLLPRNNNDDAVKEICQYILKPNEVMNFPKNATVLSDDIDEYNCDSENNTTDYCPNTEHDDIPADNDIFNAYDANPTASGYTDNLIEIPKLTQKIFIPYSQRARKLDMRRLKKTIWNSLISQSDNDANREDLTEQESAPSTIKGEVKFSDVHVGLPQKLSSNDAEELSFATSFVSLLHLANEQNLHIVSKPDFSDVIITQDKE